MKFRDEKPSDAAVEAYAAVLGRCPSRKAPALVGMHPDLAPLLLQETTPAALRLSAAAWWDRLVEAVSIPLAALRSHGLPVWAWKGFDYARSLYPGPWMRPMRDVDLLVRRSDLDAVAANFVASGWSAVSPGRPLLTSGLVAGMGLTLGTASVDLHSSPLYFPALLPGRLPADLLEPRKEIATGLFALSPAHSLMLSIVHLLSHLPPRQIWWVDSALLCGAVAREGGWKDFAFGASRTGLGRRILGVLLSMRDSMGVSVPGEVAVVLSRSADRGRLFELAATRRGMPSVSAALCSRGWRKASFVAALLYRASMRLPAAGPRSEPVRRDVEHG